MYGSSGKRSLPPTLQGSCISQVRKGAGQVGLQFPRRHLLPALSPSHCWVAAGFASVTLDKTPSLFCKTRTGCWFLKLPPSLDVSLLLFPDQRWEMQRVRKWLVGGRERGVQAQEQDGCWGVCMCKGLQEEQREGSLNQKGGSQKPGEH